MHVLAVSMLCFLALTGCGGSEGDSQAGEGEAEAEGENTQPLTECDWNVTSAAQCPARSQGSDDLSCSGNNTPPKATGDAIVVSGFVIDALSRAPIVGATIQGFDPKGNPVGSLVTTCADGSYEGRQPIPPAGFTGSLRVSAPGYWDNNLYLLSRPRTTDLTCFDILMVSEDAATLQAGILGIASDKTKGLVALNVWDCDENYLAGATADIDLDYEVRVYLNGQGIPDSSLQATAEVGVVVFANVTPGTTTATAHVGGNLMGSATMRVTAGNALSATSIEPN